MQERRLSEAHIGGGLSSFPLIFMVAAHLQAEALDLGENPSFDALPGPGYMLSAFFNRYGCFDCSTQAISVNKVSRISAL